MPLTPPAPRRQLPAPRRRKPAVATLGEVFSPAPSALTTPHPSVSSFPSQEGTVLVPSSRSLGSSAQRKHAGDPGAPPVRATARLRAAELHHRGRRIRSRGAERSEVAPPTTGGPLRVWCCMVRFVRRPDRLGATGRGAAGRLRVLGIECVGVIAGSVNAALPARRRRPSWARWEFDGGYAEYALLPDELLIPVGSSLDWPVLGALPETYLTAWGAMQALGIAGDGHGGRAERHDLRAVARAADTLPTRSGSAISAAERIDIGHGPDKYVPVDSAVPWQTRAWSSGSACPGVSEGADLGGAVLPGDIRDVQCVSASACAESGQAYRRHAISAVRGGFWTVRRSSAERADVVDLAPAGVIGGELRWLAGWLPHGLKPAVRLQANLADRRRHQFRLQGTSVTQARQSSVSGW